MFIPPLRLGPETIRVRLISSDEDLSSRVKKGVEHDRRFEIEVVCQQSLAAVPLSDLKRGVSVLIVDIDAASSLEIVTLETLTTDNEPDVPVIVVSDNLGEATARRLLRLRVSDWLPRAASNDDLLQACERALRSGKVNRHDTQATCYAFYAALGGVGNTTLAIESAVGLVKSNGASRSVCIVDLNLQSGATAEYLDIRPNLKLEDIASTPERLDTHLLEVLLSRHSSGIALLSSPNSLNIGDKVRPEFITQLLNLAVTKFDDVVLDLPRQWLPWSQSILRASNKFFIVTDLSVPGLRHARRLADEMQRLFDVPSKGRVIVNKYRWLGNNGIKKSDAYEALGERLAGFIPDMGSSVRDCQNRGIPMSEVKKGSRLEKCLTAILQKD